MRGSVKGYGIISYAGFKMEQLLTEMQRELRPQKGRLVRFLPLFPAELIQNMPYVGTSGRCASPSGFTVDPILYHEMLYREMPQLYVGENAVRCLRDGDFVGRDVFVDEAWVQHFPQYADFLGERLYVRLIGGGFQGVAVPQSLYPLSEEWLSAVEDKLGITQTAQAAAEYIGKRIRKGERCDIHLFESDYMQQTGLSTFWLQQRDLNRYRQNLQYTQQAPSAAPQAQSVPQYVPSLVACDLFTDYRSAPFTQKLAQLYFEGDDYISDFWIPWKQAWTLGDLKRKAISARQLCQGYQLPPAAVAEGAVYPATLRVVTVHAAQLPMKIAEIGANRCYGVPSVPTGAATKLVYIENSKSLIESGVLRCESLRLLMEQTTLSEEAWLAMRQDAYDNWLLGCLTDELLTRDRVLAGLDLAMPGVREALAQYDVRVERLEKQTRRTAQNGCARYAEQTEYLQRKYRFHIGIDQNDAPFYPDEQLEQQVQELFAMRNPLPTYDWRELWKIDAMTPSEKTAEDGKVQALAACAETAEATEAVKANETAEKTEKIEKAEKTEKAAALAEEVKVQEAMPAAAVEQPAETTPQKKAAKRKPKTAAASKRKGGKKTSAADSEQISFL